jgi:hypothetical protein
VPPPPEVEELLHREEACLHRAGLCALRGGGPGACRCRRWE